jgi:hypothetical protein
MHVLDRSIWTHLDNNQYIKWSEAINEKDMNAQCIPKVLSVRSIQISPIFQAILIDLFLNNWTDFLSLQHQVNIQNKFRPDSVNEIHATAPMRRSLHKDFCRYVSREFLLVKLKLNSTESVLSLNSVHRCTVVCPPSPYGDECLYPMKKCIGRAVSSCIGRTLTIDNLNPRIAAMEYAVREPIALRAAQIEKELRSVRRIS